MGTIVSKVRLKDGTVRDFADKYSRSEINIIEAAIGQIAPELEMTVHVVDDAADMPSPAASLKDKVYIYIGSTTQNYTQNTIYVCKETATTGTYAWSEIIASKDEVINIVNNIIEENKIQVTTMPQASDAIANKVYQYIGTTDANYTNGYFYKCVSDETEGNKNNLSNWDISGDITNTFSYGENTLEFNNAGPGNVAYGFKQEFYSHTGITLSDESAKFIADKWATVPTLKLYQAKFSNGYYYIFLDSLSNTNDTAFLNSQEVYFSTSGGYKTLYRPGSQTFDAWDGPTYIGRINAGYTQQFILPNYTTYQASLPAFSGNLVADFVVDDGKKYTINFKACSPSGFTKGTGNEFTITSGNNIKVLNIDTTASQDFEDYQVEIYANGNSLNINLNLVPIINTEAEIKIKDFSIASSYYWSRIDVQPAPEQYNDAKLRDKIGKLSDALGDDVLYTNYITDKTGIITTEKTMVDSPIILTTFDTLLKELRITFEYPSGVVPAVGSCRILSGDDLFNTKLNKNLPNGTYTFQGDFISQESPLYFRIFGQNEGGSAVRIASTEQGSSSFTIDDIYEYNWIEVHIDTLSSSDPFRDSYKLVLTKDGESIKETMSRPKVPRSNAAFTDHTYAAYDETNAPEGITINDGSFIFEDVGVAQPSDNPFLPSPLPAPTYTNIKVKGWDDLVNSIDVKVKGTVNNTSINAGVTSEIATFEFYNGNESEEQDVTLEGVLNFSVAIVDYTSPVSIIFSVYDNLTQVGSYTVGIDTDGYKYINFKYTISDNIGVGNKLYKIKMTPINCNIT